MFPRPAAGGKGEQRRMGGRRIAFPRCVDTLSCTTRTRDGGAPKPGRNGEAGASPALSRNCNRDVRPGSQVDHPRHAPPKPRGKGYGSIMPRKQRNRILRLDGKPIHLVAKRGHLMVCAKGCCCGRTERGFAAVPIDFYKAGIQETENPQAGATDHERLPGAVPAGQRRPALLRRPAGLVPVDQRRGRRSGRSSTTSTRCSRPTATCRRRRSWPTTSSPTTPGPHRPGTGTRDQNEAARSASPVRVPLSPARTASCS